MSRAVSVPRADLSDWEPTWEPGEIIPRQGKWTEEEYLALTTNRLVEFSDGCLEVAAVPTTSHQLLVMYLAGLLSAFAAARHLGTVVVAPLPVRLWLRKIREPDVAFMAKEHADRMGEQCWRGADLVMEIVSGQKRHRHRDLVVKREEYAQAGIAEYWIIDRQEERITVLRLRGKRYVVHGEFDKGATAVSHLLKGFTVDVSEALGQQMRSTSAKTARKPRRSSKE